MKKGSKYKELKKTILIAIVDFNIKELKTANYHTKWQIREEKSKELILTNDFELHIIEIEKAKEALKNNKRDKTAQWMSFFDNPNSMEVKDMGKENEDINEALEELRRLSSNTELREKLERQERYERDQSARLAYAEDEGMKRRNETTE